MLFRDLKSFRRTSVLSHALAALGDPATATDRLGKLLFFCAALGPQRQGHNLPPWAKRSGVACTHCWPGLHCPSDGNLAMSSRHYMNAENKAVAAAKKHPHAALTFVLCDEAFCSSK